MLLGRILDNMCSIYEGSSLHNPSLARKLKSMASLARGMEATLPVDYIYALLGVCFDLPGHAGCEDFVLQPDYAVPVEGVYLETAKYLLTKDGANALVWTSLRLDSVLLLLSWVRDWTLHDVERPLDSPAIFLEPPLFSASGRNHDFVWHTTGGVNGRTLSLLAVCVDMVTIVPDTASPVHPDTLASYVAFLRSNVDQTATDPSDVIWRVLIADQGYSSGNSIPTRAAVPLQEGFHEFMAHADLLKATAYRIAFQITSPGRKAFFTQGGRTGLGPDVAEVGDGVYIVQGANVPMILREAGNGQYRIVGQAYVYGVMDGEAMEGDPKFEWVELV